MSVNHDVTVVISCFNYGRYVGEAVASALGQEGGPTRVITDLGVLEPDPQTCELTLTWVHPGIDPDQARSATGWPLKVADDLRVTCLLYTSPSPRDRQRSRMPSSA